MNVRSVVAVACLLASANFVHAQINPCGTDLINQQFGIQHPERLAYREQTQSLINNAYINETGERSTMVVPTVVHVLHQGGAENISDAQVLDAIRILNEDLRRQNSDTANTRALFKSYGADFNVEFRLAKVDPQGNCTNGITNTFSPITYNANDDVKETASGGINPWPVNKYFNIWVVGRIVIDQDNVIGYAYFPSWGMSNNYGVVIDNKYFGTIGSAQGQDGRTLTHEVGHCLELYHTFQSGCGGSCASSGDNVCDTPPVSDATFSCNFSLNSCGNDASGPSPYATNVVDMVENYMSYNQGFCQNIFTKGQKARSDAAFQNTFISQLITPQNLTVTGTSDGFIGAPCVLVPDFKWSKSIVCVGDSVKFTDITQNGIPNSYQWSITGTQSLNATGANPQVVFTEPGLYTVTLSVINGSGTHSITKQNIISVADALNTSGYMFFDGFENHPITTGRWQIQNASYGNGWEEKMTSNGNYTVYINNVNNDLAFMKHELYSPIYDLSNITDPKFRFKTAFALKTDNPDDKLKLYFSTDCGATWAIRFSKIGNMLASMSPSFQSVEPQSSNDWENWVVDVPVNMEGASNFMAKFVFETGNANNIYLDDINLLGLASISENNDIGSLNISPNPTSDLFTLDISSLTGQAFELLVYDLSGRLVSSQHIVGGNSITLSSQSMGLAAGMYRITLKGKKDTVSGKIIVTE